MKKNQPIFFLCCLSLLLFASSCKILPPQYKGFQNTRLERTGLTGVKLGADVVFYNPNRLKCRIKDIALDVALDDKKVGTIGEKQDILVKRKSDFTVPLGITLNPTGTIFENLSKLVEIFRDKESTLSVQGKVKVKVLGITFPVPVSFKQKVKLSQLKAG